MQYTKRGSYGNPDTVVQISVTKYLLIGLLGLIFLIALVVGGCAGGKEYSRYQKRADAQNQTLIVKQQIKTMEMKAKVIAAQDKVVQAQADQRVIKAQGIRKAQDEVQATLTPLYVQFEAIEAQKAIATSGRNNTVIYVPSGTNGTPVIAANAAEGK